MLLSLLGKIIVCSAWFGTVTTTISAIGAAGKSFTGDVKMLMYSCLQDLLSVCLKLRLSRLSLGALHCPESEDL